MVSLKKFRHVELSQWAKDYVSIVVLIILNCKVVMFPEVVQFLMRESEALRVPRNLTIGIR